MIKEILCGFFMAMADSVPGVSGGTVAFLSGEYEHFIDSFGNIIGKDKEQRKKSLLFLVRLGIGWLIGMGLSVTLLAGLFTTHIYAVSSLFLGLVAASIPLIVIEEKKTLKCCRPWHSLIFLVGVAAVISLSLMHLSISTPTLNVPSAIYVLLSGALAISAMILPGISGSTLLLAFGIYVPIITALKKLFTFDLTVLPLLILFGIGVLIGIFGSFKGIHYLLDKKRSATVSAILRLMVGSLFAVVMGPTTLKQPLPAMSIATFHFGFFIAGTAIVTVFAIIKYMMQKRRISHDGTDNAD